MVPSSWRMRTKLPEGWLPRPSWSFSTSTTWPARETTMGVPSGMAMSTA